MRPASAAKWRAPSRRDGRARRGHRHRRGGARTRCAPSCRQLVAEACDLADLAQLEAGRAARHRCARRARRAGQQRRHRRPHGAGGAACSPEDWERVMRVNLGAHVQRDAARHSASEEVDGRLHHQHVVRRGAAGLSAAQRLCGQQVGRHRPHQDAVDGAGRIRHPRQRHPAGAGGGPAHGARARGARRAASGRSLEQERVECARESVAQDFHRGQRSGRAGAVPGIRCAKTISGQAISIDGDMHRSV